MKKECDILTKKVAELIELILTTESDYNDSDPIIPAQVMVDTDYLDKLTQKYNRLSVKMVNSHNHNTYRN